MLQREGSSSRVNRRGRVSSFSIDDLEQLYAMRIVHESLAIRINVPRFTKRDIDALRGLPAPHGSARRSRPSPMAGGRPRISLYAARARGLTA
jgi:DNA-binding GntR family transcriptional regulator